MIGRIDPEGVETRVIHELIDFAGKDVLEIGCGDGRMTWRYADVAASVLAFDPDESAITTAREQIPAALKAHRSGQSKFVQPIVLMQENAKRLFDAAAHARRHGLAHGL